ncbi:hypothetical protein PLICRDRAFT_37777 [Plicaturopsis crispa FD-325 SS-3]|nr:hypothetical protein PLICRDRAFT_37777 [Plicaturopsis crispa FD-325 SS-3]
MSASTVFIVTITVDPANTAAYLKELKWSYDHVIAEPECLSFEVLQDPKTPGVIKLIESWSKDLEWILTVQLKKKYYEPYVAATEKMWIKPRVIEYFEPIPGWKHPA